MIDPVTGYLYLVDWHIDCFSTNATTSANLIVVDPGNATVLHDWTYPLGLVSFAVHGGQVYAGHFTFTTQLVGGTYTNCNARPDGNISVIDGSNGSITANITLPAGTLALAAPGYVPLPLGIDPAGRWLFVPLTTRLSTATYRVNVTDRTYTPFGIAGNYAFSTDGRRVYLCDGYRYELWAYWLTNGSLTGKGSCRGPMAVNPVAGTIASDGSGLVTMAGIPVGTSPALSFVSWTPDGRALLGVQPTTNGSVFGSWDGAPVARCSQTLINPWKDPLRVNFNSVAGIDPSSVQFAIDARPATTAVTWPTRLQAYVNLTAVPDGIHILDVSGADLLGQPLRGTWNFETDGSPPVIQILSSNRTAMSPYGLVGRLNESHPLWVRVNGEPVPLSGTSWLAQVPVRIGDNRIFIEAGDSFGNVANRTFHVWYWPPHSDNLTNDADHITVSVPPSWVGQVNVSLGGGTLENVTLSMMLIGPPDGSTAATFIVTALPLPDAQESQEYVMKMALWQRDLVANFGGVIIVEPWNDTVDGHPAVTLEALVTSGSDTAVSMVTVVVSSAWKLEYILTFDFSQPLWPAYTDSREWILEGFHIEVAPQTVVAPSPGWEAWQIGIASGGVAGAAVGVAALWLLRRRRGGPNAAPRGPR